MRSLRLGILLACTLASTSAAIWEFDVGGAAGSGLLGGNMVDALPDSFASGKEVGHNEIPGILYDDVLNVLEFHVGWGDHEVVKGRSLAGQYLSSGLYAPASIYENAPGPLYTFDSSNGYVAPSSEPTGRTGFIHAQVQLVDFEGYSVAQQEADLLGNRFYFSILSTAYEGGEIRGNLLRVIPEPSDYALCTAVLLLGVAGYQRRRNRMAKQVR